MNRHLPSYPELLLWAPCPWKPTVLRGLSSHMPCLFSWVPQLCKNKIKNSQQIHSKLHSTTLTLINYLIKRKHNSLLKCSSFWCTDFLSPGTNFSKPVKYHISMWLCWWWRKHCLKQSTPLSRAQHHIPQTAVIQKPNSDSYIAMLLYGSTISKYWWRLKSHTEKVGNTSCLSTKQTASISACKNNEWQCWHVAWGPRNQLFTDVGVFCGEAKKVSRTL